MTKQELKAKLGAMREELEKLRDTEITVSMVISQNTDSGPDLETLDQALCDAMEQLEQAEDELAALIREEGRPVPSAEVRDKLRTIQAELASILPECQDSDLRERVEQALTEVETAKDEAASLIGDGTEKPAQGY